MAGDKIRLAAMGDILPGLGKCRGWRERDKMVHLRDEKNGR